MGVKRIIITVICILGLAGAVIGIKYLMSVHEYRQTMSNLKIDGIDLSKVPDGNYTGSFDVGYIAAEVSVTVKDKKIVNVTLLKHKNERGKSAERIVQDVVDNQSLQVDTVSGATNSSKVILKAIENAINSSKS